MKIIFFVENNHAGGMDSFFGNIINHWPFEDDELCLICNHNHPGLPNIKSLIKRKCEFITHKITTNVQLVDKIFAWLPPNIRRVFNPFFRVVLTRSQFKSLRKIFNEVNGDRLLSVNGAYPGGETCRLANIAWASLGKNKSVHNIRNFAIPPRIFFGWYENYMDNLLERSVHSYIGVSKCCAESLRLRPNLRHSKKIKAIYNGVPKPINGENGKIIFNIRKELEINDAPLCLMLGTYETRKGHEFLFRAFDKVSSRFPDVNLVICGDGTKEEIRAVELLKSDTAPNAKIHLLEFIPDGKKLITQADILVVASQEWESFGWTVIEAMVRGVPVVSTNVGGLAEVVGESGVAGYSIDPKDHDKYATAIMGLIENNKKRALMGKEGKKRVAKNFTVERMALDYANLVRSSEN